MAMAVENRNTQSHLNVPGYEALRYNQSVPQFTNPWTTNTTSAPPSHMYTSTSGTAPSERPTSLPMPAYGIPVTSSGMPAGTFPLPGLVQSSIDMSQELLSGPRSFNSLYSTAGPPTSFPQSSAPGYAMDYSTKQNQQPFHQTFGDRRPSHPSVASGALMEPQIDSRRSSLIDFHRLNSNTTSAQRTSFGDAVDASRQMVTLSQSDITPRNIYDVRNNPPGNTSRTSSQDSYGFPSTHSSHSSISSASTYPSSYGYNPSVAGSDISDYSSTSDSVDNSRTLPRPNYSLGTAPPPQSMMGQFSSKVSSSTQKKHKCKICDKRFTRPSSLQTHMYSHTGEKPFACEVDGCGRHFSVVSNLRRHRKVHKTDGQDAPTSSDDA